MLYGHNRHNIRMCVSVLVMSLEPSGYTKSLVLYKGALFRCVELFIVFCFMEQCLHGFVIIEHVK